MLPPTIMIAPTSADGAAKPAQRGSQQGAPPVFQKINVRIRRVGVVSSEISKSWSFAQRIAPSPEMVIEAISGYDDTCAMIIAVGVKQQPNTPRDPDRDKQQIDRSAPSPLTPADPSGSQHGNRGATEAKTAMPAIRAKRHARWLKASPARSG